MAGAVVLAEELDGVFCRGRGIGVLLDDRNEPGRFSRGTAPDLIPFDDEDVVIRCQLASSHTADDPTADDDDVMRLSHRCAKRSQRVM